MNDRRAMRSRAALALILTAALLLRIGWGVFQPTNDEAIDDLPDQREYLQLARNFLSGNGLKFTDPRFMDEVYAVRMPGYPLFVAGLGANVRLVRLAQALVDTSAVLAVYLLACHWLPKRQSLWAAGLVALNPFLIYFSGLLLSETLFTAMLIWGMCLLVRAGGREADPDPPRPAVALVLWLAGGLLLALSVHVRQSALPLPVILGVAAVFVNRHRPPPYHRRWPFPVATTMVLLTGLVLLPWGYRNYQMLGSWVWTTTNGGITAYDGHHPDATGASDQSFVEVMPELKRMDELGRDAHLKRLAKASAMEDTGRAARLGLVKAARTWSPVPLSAQYSELKYWVVGLLYTLPFHLLVLSGLLMRRRRGGPPASAKVFLLIPAIYVTGIHALTVGSLRYRVPVEPPMAVIAAASLGLLAARPGDATEWKRATGEKKPES